MPPASSGSAASAYAKLAYLLTSKKSQATPKRDLEIARRRMKEVCDGQK